ncbi:MAG: hypothetical protein C0407_12620 [Desulfobacca sp.]|nr:hypothetical protein [Desulfobacca sp.]
MKGRDIIQLIERDGWYKIETKGSQFSPGFLIKRALSGVVDRVQGNKFKIGVFLSVPLLALLAAITFL